MRTNGFEIAGAALVTGASRGIGRVIALQLGAAGTPVAINYCRGRDEANAVVSEIADAGGCAVALQADMSIRDEALGLYERAESKLGPVGVLINNAGITNDKLLIQMTPDDWDRTWLPDMNGPRALARLAGRMMASNAGGRIINISSVVGVAGNAGQANYAAAKAGLLGLTQELAVQLAGAGVTVNCVVPGYIVTAATAHLTAEQQSFWRKRIPTGRFGHAEEVASMVIFLAGSGAAYITGQCIGVDGGFLAASSGHYRTSPPDDR